MRSTAQLLENPKRVAGVCSLVAAASVALVLTAGPVRAAAWSDLRGENVPQAEQGEQVQAGAPQPGEPQQDPAQQDPAQQDPAQQDPAQQDPAQQGNDRANDILLSLREQEALALVEQIILEQEGVVAGADYRYDAVGRRDPFVSLIPNDVVDTPTVRPFGLPGFLISEIEVKAIAQAQGRWTAMVRAPNRRSYFIEVGTEVFDGHVIEIRPSEVVFQQVLATSDASGARRTRVVSKRLRTNSSGGGVTP